MPVAFANNENHVSSPKNTAYAGSALDCGNMRVGLREEIQKVGGFPSFITEVPWKRVTEIIGNFDRTCGKRDFAGISPDGSVFVDE